MRLHITRHGQPQLEGLGPLENHQFPPEDPGLTELGRRQAAYLGQALVSQGFRGPVYSSPYRRALETASLIADLTGSRIRLAPGFQEVIRWTGPAPWTGLHPDQIRREFARVDDTASLPWPWLLPGPEDEAGLAARVRRVLDTIIAAGEDALLVGHGGTVFTAINLLMTDDEQLLVPDRGYNWNCAQTTMIVGTDGRCQAERFRTAAHLPPDAITSNLATPASLGIRV